MCKRVNIFNYINNKNISKQISIMCWHYSKCLCIYIKLLIIQYIKCAIRAICVEKIMKNKKNKQERRGGRVEKSTKEK